MSSRCVLATVLGTVPPECLSYVPKAARLVVEPGGVRALEPPHRAASPRRAELWAARFDESRPQQVGLSLQHQPPPVSVS